MENNNLCSQQQHEATEDINQESFVGIGNVQHLLALLTLSVRGILLYENHWATIYYVACKLETGQIKHRQENSVAKYIFIIIQGMRKGSRYVNNWKYKGFLKQKHSLTLSRLLYSHHNTMFYYQSNQIFIALYLWPGYLYLSLKTTRLGNLQNGCMNNYILYVKYNFHTSHALTRSWIIRVAHANA